MTPPKTAPPKDETDVEDDELDDDDEETPEKAATISDVKRIVGDVVSDAVANLKDLFKGAPASGEEKPKRRSYRDEESSMEDVVSEKVKELFEAERASGSKNATEVEASEPPTAEPERTPAQPAGRRVEKLMGWS